MFENDYTINGKHATYLKHIAKDKNNPSKPYIFERYIDVYMNAAVLGFLYGRHVAKDNTSQDRARIYADAFSNEKRQCDFIYRLIMLLDKTEELSQKEQLDRAFRNDTQLKTDEDKGKHQKNMNLFHSYILGGIEILYEQFISGTTNQEDYIKKIYDITENFKAEIEGISYEDEIKESIKSN